MNLKTIRHQRRWVRRRTTAPSVNPHTEAGGRRSSSQSKTRRGSPHPPIRWVRLVPRGSVPHRHRRIFRDRSRTRRVLVGATPHSSLGSRDPGLSGGLRHARGVSGGHHPRQRSHDRAGPHGVRPRQLRPDPRVALSAGTSSTAVEPAHRLVWGHPRGITKSSTPGPNHRPADAPSRGGPPGAAVSRSQAGGVRHGSPAIRRYRRP